MWLFPVGAAAVSGAFTIAVGLFVGVGLMFWGFLEARPPAPTPG